MNASIAIRTANPVGEADIAVQGPNNELLYYYATPGAAWQSAVIMPAGSALSTPAIVVRESGEADVVVRGPHNELMYYYYTAPGAPLRSTTIAAAGTTFSAPAIAVRGNGEADVVAQGPNNELLYYHASPGAPWSVSTIARAGTTFSAPAIAVRANGEADIVAQGPNNELLYYHATPGSPWEASVVAPAGTTFSAPGLAVRANGEADIVAQGPNHELLYYHAAPGSPWYASVVAPPGMIFSAPAIAVRNSGEADIVAQGPNNELLYYYAMPGAAWQWATIAPAGTTFSAPAIAVRASGEANIVVQGPSNQLLYYMAMPGTQWTSFVVNAPTKTFGANVITPSGVALGGWVSLTVKSDGTYTVVFNMHSSSIFEAFDFQLRAYLNVPGTPVFFFYHKGHVSPNGTDNTGPETGKNPLIALYWDKIVSFGTFSCAHDYQWSGMIGALDNVVKDIIDLGVAAAGEAIGAVIAVTREAIGWLGTTLGPGGTIGVIGGFVVFAVGAISGVDAGSALILGIIAGVAAGVVSNALIKSRPLNAAEIALAQKVFGSTIPYANVIITNLAGLSGRAFTAPGVDGKTYCNLGNAFDNPLAASNTAYPAAGELLIHELTHAWQIAHNSWLPGLICSGIVTQTAYSFGDDVYDYDSAGPAWSSFNLEQQGAIVDQWFGGAGHSANYGPASQSSPFYQYITGNILKGSAGYSTSRL